MKNVASKNDLALGNSKKFLEMRKKGDFENLKVPNCDFSTNSVPN